MFRACPALLLQLKPCDSSRSMPFAHVRRFWREVRSRVRQCMLSRHKAAPSFPRQAHQQQSEDHSIHPLAYSHPYGAVHQWVSRLHAPEVSAFDWTSDEDEDEDEDERVSSEIVDILLDSGSELRTDSGKLCLPSYAGRLMSA